MATVAKSDSECVQSSYEEQMGALFKQFFMSLTGEPDARNDQVHLTRFKTGVGILHRAKALALAAVGPTSAIVAATDAGVAIPSALMSAAVAPGAPAKPRRKKSTTASKAPRRTRRKAATE